MSVQVGAGERRFGKESRTHDVHDCLWIVSVDSRETEQTPVSPSRTIDG